MSFVGSNILAGASGQGGAGYKIERSLRFNSDDNSYLNRTPATAGNVTTWTWSGWVKRSKLGQHTDIFSAVQNGQNATIIQFDNNDQLDFENFVGNSSQGRKITNALFRDTSAWYHIVVAYDSTNSTADDRVKLYVNGSQITSFSYSENPGSEQVTIMNSANPHNVGSDTGFNNHYFNGYVAEVHLIDGQALAPTEFGEFDANNVWQPKEYSGTYNAAESISSYPGVFISPSAVGGGNVSHVNGGGTYFYSSASSGAGSIKVVFENPITGVTNIKYNGGGYGAGSSYNIRINGVDVFTNQSTASGWGQVSRTITSTDISSFEIWTANSGWSLYNLLFNDTSPSGTASIGTPAGKNGFYLDFSDHSTNAALGNDKSGLATSLPCVDFDGTDDVISSADDSDYTFGTNDWTIEYFVKANSFSSYDATVCKYASGGLSWWHAFLSDKSIIFYLYDSNQSATTVSTSTSFEVGIWAHVAIVRDGNTMRIYKDGVQEGSVSITGVSVYDGSAPVTIGQDGDGNYDFSGQISNVRIVNGTCLYPNGTTFTVPSTPLTNVTNTKLLCCQSSSSVTEAAVSPNTLTLSGNPTATEVSDRAWTVNNLKAIDAYGITSAASISSSKTIDFPITYGTTVTYEFFVQVTTASTYTYFAHDVTSQDAWNIGINSSNQLLFGNYNGGWTTFSSVGIGDGNWHFVRLTTTGSSTSLYVDGSLVGTNSSGGSVTTGSQITNRLQSGAFKIAHLRITNGGTPPTNGIPAISSMNQAAGSGGTLAFYDALDDIASSGTKTSDGGNVTITMSAGTAAMIQHDIDTVIDTPTNYEATGSGNNGGNYCILNYNANVGQVLKNGNLVSNGVSGRSVGTIYVSSGKYYWEMKAGSTYTMAGIESSLNTDTSYPGASADQYALYGDGGFYHNNSVAASYTAFDEGDVLGFLLDMDAGELRIRINNVAINSGNAVATGLTGKSWTANCRSGSGSYNGDSIFNFGQQPFSFTPPSGYKSLCTTNLPDPTIEDGSKYMDVVTYSGNSSTQNITGLNFSPDKVWIKSRTNPNSGHYHHVHDSVRGKSNGYYNNLYTNTTEVENEYPGSSSGGVTAFNSDGFTLANAGGATNLNTSGYEFVAWSWDGGELATTSSSFYNQTRTWSDNAVGGRADEPIEDLFDGLTSTFAQNPSGGSNPNNLIVNFSPGLAYSSSVEVYPYNASSVAINNGSQTSTTNQQWNTVVSGYGTLTKLDFQRNHTNGCAVSAIRVDGKILINPGVVPVGSLNSSVYDQSQTWSSAVTSSTGFRSNEPATNAFDSSTSTICSAVGSGLITFAPTGTFPSSSAIRIYLQGSGSQTVTVNGGAGQTITGNSWQTVNFTNSSASSFTLTIQASGGADSGVRAIEIGGKLLVDAINDNQTWSNSLTALSGSSLTNPANGFDGDESSYADSTAGFSLDLSGHTFGTGTHTIEVKSGGASSFTVNGSTSLSGSGSGAIVWSGTHTGELTSLVSSATGASIYYIKVDGEYLLDPGQNFVTNVPSLSSTTRANPSAGFSIITLNFPSYSGTSSVAHGLNAAPDFWFMKDRDSADGWYLGHKSIGAGNYLRLESSAAAAASTTIWDNRSPDSNFIYNNGTSMSSSGSYVMYAWASVEGYSAFGSYMGNGSADGPFVYTGFKPKWVLIRCSSTTQNWVIIDAERNTYNVVNNGLYADLNNAEQTSNRADFTSNGFKIRTNSGELNTSSGTHIYAAFAEHPFKSSRAR